MSVFSDVRKEVQDGMDGKNSGIPMGFSRLNNHISIRKSMLYLVGGYTGCLSADTIIEVARKQSTANTKKYTIQDLYEKFHGLSKKDKWKIDLPTRVKVFMPDKGQTSVHEINNVVYSGTKVTFKVVTDSGKTIRATKDHKFMINEWGEFKRLEELAVGDTVICKAPKESRVKGRKLTHRKEICGKYPYYWGARERIISGQLYQRIYDYRIAYDAGLNNISTEKLLEITSTEKDHKLILSNPKYVIHHIDENPLNNSFSNLKLMSKKEHDKLHAKTSNYSHSWVRSEKIVSIEDMGVTRTFDICCNDPYHNFLANDFVVHNSGKTTLVDDAFVLNPMDYILYNQSICGDCLDLEILYFSMERRRSFKIAKWVCRKIFLDHGIVIPVSTMMGWVSKERRITEDQFRLFNQYEQYIDELTKKVTIIEHPQNPTGIKKYVDDYALRNGELNVTDKYNPIYTPFNPNKITLIIYDHIGLQKGEMRDKIAFREKKSIIDLASEDARKFRDFYGFSPVKVSQLNRDIANPMRLKNGDVEPMLEDFKNTGNVAEDADIVLSLFDPFRYNVPDPSKYDLTRLRDAEGRKKYRNLKILKNSYGSDDIKIGLAFQPEVGLFKEMLKRDVITEQDYRDILDNSYFLKK